jgi:serine acetyltransferase
MNKNGFKAKIATMLIVAAAFLCARIPDASAGFGGGDNLGHALGFSLLSLADDGVIDLGVGNSGKVTSPLCFFSGDVGTGGDILLGNNGSYSGSAVSFNGNIILNNYTKVAGQCVTNYPIFNGVTILGIGAKCGLQDDSGNNFLLLKLLKAALDGLLFYCDVANGYPTQLAGVVNLGASKKFTIVDANPGCLNFIDATSLTLGNSSTLTLSGGAYDTVVLRVDGTVSIGSGAKIVLAGGLTPADVVIVDQGGITTWGNSTTINGTIVSAGTCTIGSGATINGAVLCGQNLTLGANAHVNSLPAFAVNVPSACFLDPSNTPVPITPSPQ